MFFVLSKTIGFFALPSNSLLVLALAGLALTLTRFARAGRIFSITAMTMLAIAAWSPLGNALILPLEERFPPWDASRGAPDGIVVLGGAINPDISASRHSPALNEFAERMTVVADLARRFPNARIVFTGGDGSLLPSGRAEADVVAALFESFGIARERIELEGRSRNTAENAAFTRDLVKPKPGERWLLITSASHMPRSIGIFRQAGFPVEAHPVDWRTEGPQSAYETFFSASGGLARTDNAVREWVGLFVYWLSGRTDALFPGPRSG